MTAAAYRDIFRRPLRPRSCITTQQEPIAATCNVLSEPGFDSLATLAIDLRSSFRLEFPFHPLVHTHGHRYVEFWNFDSVECSESSITKNVKRLEQTVPRS
jgi:hypothetical protein